MSEPSLQSPRPNNITRIATERDVKDAAIQQARALAPHIARIEQKLTLVEQRLDRIIEILKTVRTTP
jgi:hypothetical protein